MTIRVTDSTTYEDGKQNVEICCSSEDTKPTAGIATGSICLEADTGKFYTFNEDDSSWNEL